MTLKPIKVHIENFQSIEKLDFSIGGFTCITGKTNIGKSAIMRAISKAILNDPVVNLVRKGEQNCVVKLDSEKWSFKWEKGEKGVNRYFIDDRILDKTGQKQIEDMKGFGFKYVKIGDDEIYPWFASQFEPIFLLNKSGPQITDFVSEVSGLNVLQDSIVLSSRGRKKCLDEVKTRQSDIEVLEEKLLNFSNFDNLLSVLTDIEEQKKSIKECAIKLEKIITSFDIANKLQNQIKTLNLMYDIKFEDHDISKYGEHIKIFKIWKKMRNCADNIISFRKIKDLEIPSISNEFKDSIITLKKMNKSSKLQVDVLEISKATDKQIENVDKQEVEKFRSLFVIHSKILKLQSSLNKLEQHKFLVPKIENLDINKFKNLFILHKKISDLKIEITNMENETKNVKSMLTSVDEEISMIPKCPTCGRPSKPIHQHHVQN